jgi:methylamine dehydrogenase accessory protein MauD
MTGLLISQLMLWTVVVALSLVCLALTRQLGVLHERIAPMGALALNRRLAGGSLAPPLSLQTLTGVTITVGAPIEGIQVTRCQLIFFLSPNCPICKKLLPVLKSIKQTERSWLSVVLASDGEGIVAHRQFVQEQGLEGFHYVVSQSLGVTYGVARLPYAVLIDEQGIVSAFGLVNSREQLESLFEARKLRTPTIQDFLQAAEARSATTAPQAMADDTSAKAIATN